MTSGLVPRLALLLAATDAALKFGAHCRAPRAPQRIAPLRAAIADSRYRKSTDLYKQLEDGRTLVSIAEEGWRDDPSGRKNSYGNCMGWAQMLCAMKAWLEHGINLREGMYK